MSLWYCSQLGTRQSLPREGFALRQSARILMVNTQSGIPQGFPRRPPITALDGVSKTTDSAYTLLLEVGMVRTHRVLTTTLLGGCAHRGDKLPFLLSFDSSYGPLTSAVSIQTIISNRILKHLSYDCLLDRYSALLSIHHSFFYKLKSGKSYAILPAPRSVATSHTIAPLLFPPSPSKVTAGSHCATPLPRRMIRLSYFLTISFPNTLPPSSTSSLPYSLCPLHHRPLTVETTPSTSSSSSPLHRLSFATLL